MSTSAKVFLVLMIFSLTLFASTLVPDSDHFYLERTGMGKYDVYYSAHLHISTAVDLDSAMLAKVLLLGRANIYDTVFDPAGFWGINLERTILQTDFVDTVTQISGPDKYLLIYPRHVKPTTEKFPNYQGRIGLALLWLLALIIILSILKPLPRAVFNYSTLIIIYAGLFPLIYLAFLGFGKPVLMPPACLTLIAAAGGAAIAWLQIFVLSRHEKAGRIAADDQDKFYRYFFWWSGLFALAVILYSSRLNVLVYLLAIASVIIFSFAGVQIGHYFKAKKEKKDSEIEAMMRS
jgi:hypothetical protein